MLLPSGIITMKKSEQWPQVGDARIENRNGRLYLCFHDGNRVRRKFVGEAPADWPRDSIPAGKKRYGKRRAESHPEREYHKPATRNTRSEIVQALATEIWREPSVKQSIYLQEAYDDWALNAKEHGGIPGDGPFAVVFCTFFHPSVRDWCLGEVRLAETLEEAQKIASTGYCHASSKGLCKGNHAIYQFDEQAQRWCPLRSVGS